MPKDKRKKYWNTDYYNYWLARVKEANSATSMNSLLCNKDVITTGDEEYFSAIDLLLIDAEDLVLEVGCGFGRSLPHLYKKSKNIYGIDISETMIECAKKACNHLPNILLEESEAENTNFDNEYFDKLICYGVFDALFQTHALIEFNRILRLQGNVLLTGKNNNYFIDDKLALVAEKNASLKNHPNFFTCVSFLLENIHMFGFEVSSSRFYLRRGDTVENKYVSVIPKKFYQYTLTLKKISRTIDGASTLSISSHHSLTFKKWSGK